jgi:hypothetical protein
MVLKTEIVDIVSHLRLNFHSVLEAESTSFLMRNEESGNPLPFSLLERTSHNSWMPNIVLSSHPFHLNMMVNQSPKHYKFFSL